MTRSKLLIAVSLLAVIGLVLSSLSLLNHYKTSATDYCDLSDNFNCDLVNRSQYSEVARVPVAAIGMAGYAFLLVLSRLSENSRRSAKVMLAAAIVGLGFALYLTYIEAYKLQAWCIICLGSLAAILLLTPLAAIRVATGPPARAPGAGISGPEVAGNQ